MTEYIFTPDFKAWWNNQSATQEDFAWIILGIDPVHLNRLKEINTKTTEITTEELRFRGQFDYYTLELPRGMFLKDTHIALMNLPWNDDKEAFINEAYTQNFDIHPGLCAHLQSIDKMPHNPGLERYTDHSQYKDNLENWEPSKITDEDTALPLLLGLNPEYFTRFLTLHYRQDKEERTPDNLAPYYRFKPEEKWLFSNYHDFLKEKFPDLAQAYGCPIFYIAKRYQKAKDLNLWTGAFAAYIQALHDNGFIFMPRIYDSLKKHGISPSYSANGWAMQFYQRFLRQPLWKLKDAASIYRGSDPNGSREFVDFANTNALHGSGAGFALETSETIAEFDGNDKFVPPPEQTLAEIMKNEKNPFDDPISLEGFVRRHLEAESLVDGNKFEAIEKNGELYFKPEMIVKFFRDYLPRTHRPKALYIEMGLEALSASKSFAAPKDAAAHEVAYRAYHDEQIALYMEEKVQKPWVAQDKEEPVVSQRMGDGFDRAKFREARKKILAPYPGSGKTNLSANDHATLKAFITEQKQAA